MNRSLLVTLDLSPQYPSAIKRKIEMGLVAYSFDVPVTFLFQGPGLALLDPGLRESAPAIAKQLGSLAAFGVTELYYHCGGGNHCLTGEHLLNATELASGEHLKLIQKHHFRC